MSIIVKMDNKKIAVNLLILIIKIFVTIYDIVTIPFYYYIQKPMERLEYARQQKGKNQSSSPIGPWERADQPSEERQKFFQECENITNFFDKVVSRYSENDAFGQRTILEETEDIQANGRVFKKFVLGDYQWMTYSQAQKRINNIACGFMECGVKRGDIVMIMADTRSQWMLSALALIKIGATVSTLYATLGEDGIVHGLNETEVSHLITNQDLLKKLVKTIGKTPMLRNIIYFEGFHKDVETNFPPEVKVTPFKRIEELGQQKTFPNVYPKAKLDDLAILMYTSGSTGVPKAVMLTHRNILSSALGYAVMCPVLHSTDIVCAYLPLAHILEMASEFFWMSCGMAIGYGSPLTITDKSMGIKKGCPGDFSVLKPTIAAAVPLVLDRIRKGILEELEAKGAFAKQLFDFVVDYKRKWTKQGYRTPIVNALVCRKISQVLGGRIRFIPVGGAPLGPDTHEFIEACLDCTVLQGYALTEVAAAGTLMGAGELSSGRVGAPLGGVKVKLVDWDEGNYRVTDKPYPRGEVIIGGHNVSKGYYKNDKLTEESYYEEDGIRWFRTGDIAEIWSNGTVKIVDRRKDLVKLQYGEYVSLGKVEAELKCNNYVDNICVIGDSFHDHLIALIVPNIKNLKLLAESIGKSSLTFAEMCRDYEITKLISTDIMKFSKDKGLNKMETPSKIRLVSDEWMPDTGLVTAALKIRRKNIQDHYRTEIMSLYGKL